ncbi:energy transducer TonB [Algoriphagus halophytocola]|uniref:Energy transducer TonB n=1 Tax=Algoriphagus halophytocola TaxID=2991499 RepID=A0ABY6MMW2_9BACT|nr:MULTISPECIES: energy transducer TonB [unclassified Algoriphagus]UZD23666.1 energy transducer TonB [Algoriphagus sp. TR-M5]WBL44959.1 energy transducer TonB [Algoriphagus sp. TR-M9]
MKNLALKSLPAFLLVLAFFTSLSMQGAYAQTEAFEKVDKMPEPKDGMDGLVSYIGDNLIYPEDARKKGVEGVVVVSFVVQKEGDITDVKILRGIGTGCDEEAMRVVQGMPNWIPGEKDGSKVNTKMSLPIKFKL